MNSEILDLIAKFAGPVATVIASIAAAGVTIFFSRQQARSAKRQIEIANDKIALDLFQRRFDVYQRIRGPVGEITRSGASTGKIERDLLEAIDAARFLFGTEVRAYLDGLYDHLVKLDYCNTALKDPNLPTAERGKLASGRTTHFQEITSFYNKIDSIFGPYLSATHKFINPRP